MKKPKIEMSGAEVTRTQFLKGLGAFGVVASSGGLLAGCGGGTGGSGQNGGSGGKNDYPDKPITCVVPIGPGAGQDITMRVLVETFQKENLVDVPMQVENQPGGGSAVALSRIVRQDKGTDDTISINATPLIVENELRGDSKYGIDDVTPIARLVSEYSVLVVAADSPYKTAQALIDDLSKNPESVSVGGTIGDRVVYPVFVDTIGGDPAKAKYIMYEAGAEIITAMLNGDLDAGIASISEFQGQLASGDLRGLVLMGDEPVGGATEGVANMKELGYEFPPMVAARFIFGPPDMPKYAVTYWQDTIEKALKTETWKENAEKNQWNTTFMKGEEYQRFLDGVQKGIRDTLEQTGQLQEA